MATKQIGGTDGQHRKPEKHPFSSRFGNHSGAGKGRSGAVHPSAAGSVKKGRSATSFKGK